MIPTISKATIYNTLKVLQEKDLVTTFNLSGEEARFDFKRKAHAHFHCIRCDRVIDVKSEYPCFKMNRIGANQVSEVQLVFKGTCKKCQKDIPEQGSEDKKSPGKRDGE